MKNLKIRVPWPEAFVAIFGGVAILVGVSFSIGVVGAIGIPVVAISVIAAILTLPLSPLPNKWQFALIAVGILLVVGGAWYGIDRQEEAAIFSPALVWFLGCALIMSAVFTLLFGAKLRKA